MDAMVTSTAAGCKEKHAHDSSTSVRVQVSIRNEGVPTCYSAMLGRLSAKLSSLPDGDSICVHMPVTV